MVLVNWGIIFGLAATENIINWWVFLTELTDGFSAQNKQMDFLQSQIKTTMSTQKAKYWLWSEIVHAWMQLTQQSCCPFNITATGHYCLMVTVKWIMTFCQMAPKDRINRWISCNHKDMVWNTNNKALVHSVDNLRFEYSGKVAGEICGENYMFYFHVDGLLHE